MTEERKPFTDKQLKILRQLVELLGRKNFQKITTGQLAKELNISESALYRHFYNKNKIVSALVDFIEDIILAELDNIASQDGTSLSVASDMMHFLIEFMQENPGLSRLLTREALYPEYQQLAERVDNLYDSIHFQFRYVLGNTAGQEDFPTPKILAELMVAIFDYSLQVWLRSGLQSNLLDIAEPLWEALLKPYSDTLAATKVGADLSD